MVSYKNEFGVQYPIDCSECFGVWNKSGRDAVNKRAYGDSIKNIIKSVKI
jgi:hypothetical protein